VSDHGETTTAADWPDPILIGDVRVHPVLDGIMPMPLSVLYPDVSAELWRTISTDLTADGRLNVPYGGFIAVDASGNTVLIDTGGGPAPSPLPDGSSPVRFGELPRALGSLGVDVEKIGLVVLTHLHPDHIGWATLNGAPFFPNATYYVHELEWASLGADREARDVLHPIAPRLAVWSGVQATPLPWLSLHHAPGHSPGNTVVMVSDVEGGNELALVGDLFHHPAGIAHPHWRCGFDANAEDAARQRVRWADRLRARGTPVVSSHFPGLQPLITY
jgi:glyoxylase-like metal-dependent hydrolase (beta-lactamase superfamily II)